MGTQLGFVPSDGNYRFNAPLEVFGGTSTFTFDVRWNERDEAWYFDMYDPDGILMVAGVKVVINVPLGRRSTHPFFNSNVIVALDTSGTGENPGFDDIGFRVQIWHLTLTDYVALRMTL